LNAPPYQDRTNAEIIDAVHWAEEKLHLNNWSIAVFVDDPVAGYAADSVLREQKEKGIGGTNHYSAFDLDSNIGIVPANCKEKDMDPINVAFHEVAHLATDMANYAGCGGFVEDGVELLTNRMTCVLWELWQHEQPPKRSD